MKELLAFFAILIVTICLSIQNNIFAQNEQDPFAGNYILGNSAELYLMTAERSETSTNWITKHIEEIIDFDNSGKLKTEAFIAYVFESYPPAGAL